MMLRYLYRRSLASNLPKIISARTFAEEPAGPETLITQLYEHLPTARPKYIRNLRFKKFVEKMERLYLLERDWARAAEKRDKDFMIYTVSSKTPVHDILTYYLTHNKSGFSARTIAACLKGMGNVFQVRGPIPVHYFDYNREELIKSWQMYHLLEDIKHGLKISTLILPHDLSKIVDGLNSIGYKDSDLQRQFLAKVNDMLENPYRNYLYKDGGVGDATLSQKNMFEAPRKVIRDFMESEEFEGFLTDAIEWKSANQALNSLKEQDSLEAHITRLVSAVKETKDFQDDLAEAVYNVRNHYFKLKDALNKHETILLRDSQELQYDLLELEDLLVKAGLIDPRETYTIENDTMRVQRAMHIFDDLCSTFHPELLSPRHERLMEAVKDATKDPEKKWTAKEPHNEMIRAGIGRCLNTLVDSAYSQQLDLQKKDYLNESFEQSIQQRTDNKGVLEVDPTYTTIWRDTRTEMEKILKKYVEPQIKKCTPIEILFLISAYARMGFSLENLFPQMMDILCEDWDWMEKAPTEDLYKGLYALAMSCFVPEEARAVATRMAEELYKRCENDEVHFSKSFVFKTLWSMCNFGEMLYRHPLVQVLIDELNAMPIDRLTQDLFPEEIALLNDICLAWKHEGNKVLPDLQVMPHVDTSIWYKPKAGMADPCKAALIEGVKQGMGSDGTHVKLIETRSDYEKDSPVNKFAAVPDLVIGYHGKKLGVFFMNEAGCATNPTYPNGKYRFQFRINESIDPSLTCAVIPIRQIVDFDPLTLETTIKESAPPISTLLENYTKDLKVGLDNGIKAAISRYLDDFAETSQDEPTFAFRLLRLIKKDKVLQTSFNGPELGSALIDMKIELARIAMDYAKLPKVEQDKLDRFAGETGAKSFAELLHAERDHLDAQERRVEKTTVGTDKLSKEWLGQRLTIHVPSLAGGKAGDKKKIGPELLDSNFMLLPDYAQYKDWKGLLREHYDNLNLLTIPPTHNYMFSEPRLERGIFPNPAEYRRVDTLHSPEKPNSAALDKNPLDLHKNPTMYLMRKELEKQKWNKPIPAHVKMIVNLSNIKHGLKANYPADELMHKILSLDFIESLMQRHLSQKEGTKRRPFETVPRDPECFKTFLKKQATVNEFYDPFTHFYLKEHQKREAEKVKGSPDGVPEEDKDRFNLGTFMPMERTVTIDTASLLSPANSPNKFPLTSKPVPELPGDILLAKYRREAEAKLIKAALIKKVHEGTAMSESEKRYLKKWLDAIRNCEDESMVGGVCIPEEVTDMTFGELSGIDRYNLNTIPLVNLSPDLAGFGLTDLVLELSHFVDSSFIDQVSRELYWELKVKPEWKISSASGPVYEHPSKEAALLMQKYEEVGWREGGAWSPEEVSHLKEMLSITRGKDDFDVRFIKNDMNSLEEFVNDSNPYDNRFEMLEKWIVRKEREIRQRKTLAGTEAHKTDKQIWQEKERKAAEKRRKILEAVTRRNYNEISKDALGHLVDKLCKRLYLFDGEYPQFVVDLVKEIRGHPNLSVTDQQRLETYAEIFNVNWKEKLGGTLAQNPIYLDGPGIAQKMDSKEIVKEVQRASIPYMGSIVHQMSSMI